MDYVEYDERGIKTTRCMHCGVVIADRLEFRHQLSEKETLVEKVYTRLPNFSANIRVKINLKVNGKDGFIEPLLCKDCINAKLEVKDIIEKMKRGYFLELKSAGRSDESVNEILGKLDIQEA